MSKSRHVIDKPTAAEDLWMKLEHQSINSSSSNSSSSNVPIGSNDVLEVNSTSLVFIGDYQSGKSTLISIFQKPTASTHKDIKPTIALDYSFARRTANNIKSVANFWEIGGDLVEPRLIEIGITLRTLPTAAVIVTVDLSKPHNLVTSLLRSISAIKEIVSRRVAELQASNVLALNEIRDKLNAPYKGHVDANRMKPLDVQVCIVANKHDLFKSLPSSHRRSTIQVLRFIAHFFGAHLITMSSSSESSVRDTYRALISSFAFSTPIKPAHEVSNTADKLIFVTRGSDSYKSILLDYNVGILDTADVDSKHSKGLVANESDMDKLLTQKGVTKDCWRRISEYMVNLFGEPDPLPSSALSAKDIDTGEVEGEGGPSDNPFPEAEIDDMRAVRDAALTRFIQEAERKEEFAAKMNARSSTAKE